MEVFTFLNRRLTGINLWLFVASFWFNVVPHRNSFGLFRTEVNTTDKVYVQ